MDNIRDIRERIKSVREIRKITRAMKMVATAKFKKADRRLKETWNYNNTVDNLIVRMSKEVVTRYNPYFTENKNAQKDLLILVTSDKGLCGGFNANLIRMAQETLSNRTNLFVIGKKGRNFFRKIESVNIDGEEVELFGNLTFKHCRIIMDEIKNRFKQGLYGKVQVLYTHFETMGTQPLKLETVLPLQLPESTDESSPETLLYEPCAEPVFNRMINHYIELQLFRILLESELSEHVTRMNAMDAATKNASELIDTLVLNYNRARQAVITREIIEIVSGAQALNK